MNAGMYAVPSVHPRTALYRGAALADVLGERDRIITNDQHAAHLFSPSAREIRRSLEILDRLDLSSGGVRRDLTGPRTYPGYLYSASELLDLAADGLAESAALIHDNERRWRVWRARAEEISAKIKPVQAKGIMPGPIATP